jgi:hypothetical protein
MLTFKSLTTNDVDLWKSLLTSVLTFKSLAINDVALVDLYMRYMLFHVPKPPCPLEGKAMDTMPSKTGPIH